MASMINCPYTGKSVDSDACAATKRDGAVICVTCGTNLLTGQKIVDAKEVDSGSRSGFPMARVALLMAILLVVAALIGTFFLYVNLNPVKDARRLYQEGNVLGAINTLQDHVSSSDDDGEAHLMLGKLRWLNQDYAGALSAFDSAARLNPKDRDAALLAVLASGRLEGDNARNRQLQTLNRAVENHPDDASARYLLGMALGASADYTAQREQLAPLLQEEPDNVPLETYLSVGQALGGDTEGARTRLEQLQRDVDGEIALAILNSINDDTEKTRLQLQNALNSGADVEKQVDARLGLLYMVEGNYSSALNHLNRTQTKPDPKSPTAFFRALCLQQLGQNVEALAAFDQIVQVKAPFSTEASAQLAMLYSEQGNIQKAEESIRAALSSGAGSARLYTIQGRIHVSKGDSTQGQNSFQQAMNLEPEYAPAYLENGLAYIARGMTKEGVNQLKKYLDLKVAQGQESQVIEITMLVEQLEQSLSNSN